MNRHDFLQQSSAIDRAYNAIRNMIMRQELRLGEKTSVITLSDSTGFGRTPIKEAITRLAAEGLLTVKGRSGTFVARLDIEDIHHLFDLRRMFESHAARRAVWHVTDDRVRRMERHLNEMWQETIGKPSEERSLSRFVDADVAFHLEIIKAAGNPYLMKQFETLNLQMQILTYLFHAGSGPAERRHAEHSAILDAFRKGAEDVLEHALIEHANRVEQATKNSMDKRYGSIFQD